MSEIVCRKYTVGQLVKKLLEYDQEKKVCMCWIEDNCGSEDNSYKIGICEDSESINICEPHWFDDDWKEEDDE